MSESDFVDVDVERLYLADACRRDLEALLKREKAATQDEIAQAEAKLATAIQKGHWIDVKKELNAGEQRKLFARLIKSMNFVDKPEIDPEQVGFSKVVQYLVGWSLKDKQGRTPPVSESAINNTKGGLYGQIANCVEWWDDLAGKAIDDRKNETADTTTS